MLQKGHIAMSNVTAQLFNDILSSFNIELKSLQIIDLSSLPKALSLFIFFIVSDFVQWNTHRLLHRFDFFWKY